MYQNRTTGQRQLFSRLDFRRALADAFHRYFGIEDIKQLIHECSEPLGALGVFETRFTLLSVETKSQGNVSAEELR